MDGYHAWMLIASSLVLLMIVPGLALFYGGMGRSSSVLNSMMMSFSALGVVGVVYALWGWSMSFSSVPDEARDPSNPGWDAFGLFASPFDQFGLEGTLPSSYITVGFQLCFAAITAALVSGSIVDRAKFSAWLLFLPIWATLSYFPLAHQVWGGGFLSGSPDGLSSLVFGTADATAKVVPVDYAGGTVVHINAGTAGLVLALVVGHRTGFGTRRTPPHNPTLTMVGAGMLWVGWLGFNVGSMNRYGLSDAQISTQFLTETGLVWLNSTLAACSGMLGWLVTEKLRTGKLTPIGAAMGVVAGLVAITPACSAVSPLGSLGLGALAGLLCSLAVGLKYRFSYDDSLDVVAIHLVGGFVGTVSIGLLSSAAGLLYGHGLQLLVAQVLVSVFALVWSAIATLTCALLIKYAVGWRLPTPQEVEGVDAVEHGESTFDPRHRLRRGPTT
jgi:ammonium transporter, Amt family